MMYVAQVSFSASVTMLVEASSKKEAEEKAMEAADTVCHKIEWHDEDLPTGVYPQDREPDLESEVNVKDLLLPSSVVYGVLSMRLDALSDVPWNYLEAEMVGSAFTYEDDAKREAETLNEQRPGYIHWVEPMSFDR